MANLHLSFLGNERKSQRLDHLRKVCFREAADWEYCKEMQPASSFYGPTRNPKKYIAIGLNLRLPTGTSSSSAQRSEADRLAAGASRGFPANSGTPNGDHRSDPLTVRFYL